MYLCAHQCVIACTECCHKDVVYCMQLTHAGNSSASSMFAFSLFFPPCSQRLSVTPSNTTQCLQWCYSQLLTMFPRVILKGTMIKKSQQKKRTSPCNYKERFFVLDTQELKYSERRSGVSACASWNCQIELD